MYFKLVILACITLCFASGAWAAEEEICCTWVNAAYNTVDAPQKLIINYDGSFQGYATLTATEPISMGTFQIVKKWNDADQNIWYQIQWANLTNNQECLKLVKVSAAGDTMESVFASQYFPKEIDSNNPKFQTYSRCK